ncbi:23S rRNA (adenine(2503)-C(2))-methyltransferase RlmN [Candidatus Parcubacteria bacterium]|nr:23S rRNA (adenine(2503)-C(2))-methyltransferase RlmN [Patescibacteria group bacterium]MBU4467007.1 23S rRNA (adenine(2503)-C(2))-methyltransferase RlmN [Patescibacteria group bacterium]MCG2688406.1 23S rRNA (adenine(2503)-C(2))-methyltransferase RlmN [Candidatus Parcubacteria bacterium]
MDLGNLEKVLAGEPAFRLGQAKQAVFRDLIEDWQEATVLPLSLREKLSKDIPLKVVAEISVSKDKKTIKALINLKDDLKIEAVLMRHQDRNTVCLSSMVGCPLACEFCATGKIGFKRNLTIAEIINQVLLFNRYLKKENQRVNSIVFMGMGEPFLNYDNVLGAIRVLNDQDYFNIGARHISISTVGIIDGVEKLAKESLQVNLAISLHAANDSLRSEIMPINKNQSLGEVLKSVENYFKTTRRKVMFEYIMIAGINDSLKNARELTGLLAGLKSTAFMVNLISYNPTGIFKASTPKQIKDFKSVLEKSGIEVTQRYRFGQTIKAACGQLAADKT